MAVSGTTNHRLQNHQSSKNRQRNNSTIVYQCLCCIDNAGFLLYNDEMLRRYHMCSFSLGKKQSFSALLFALLLLIALSMHLKRHCFAWYNFGGALISPLFLIKVFLTIKASQCLLEASSFIMPLDI